MAEAPAPEPQSIDELTAAVAATVPEAPDIIADAVEAETPPAVEVASVAAIAPTASVKPRARPDSLVVLASLPADDAVATQNPAVALAAPVEQEVVTRLSTSSGRHWGINVGRFGNRHAAKRMLLQTALTEINTLDGTLRKVVPGNGGFDANFMGMTRETADLACRRLQVRQVQCFMIGPS